MESTETKSNKNDYLIHYKKINIMGDESVGKSSLITFFENYYNRNFVIKTNNELSRSQSEISNENPSLVEQIKRITVEHNGSTNLYLNIYETNLDEIENIKNNLDTLLFNTECIIFIYDKNNLNTFNNIKKLIPIITEKIQKHEIRNIPIFLIKNKMDEESDEQNDNEIEKFKDLVIFETLSLLNRDKFENFIYDFYKYCYTHSKIDKKDYINIIKLNDPLRQTTKNFNNTKSNIKLLLVGSSNVGKTSFINYFYGKKIDNVLSTIGSDEYNIYAEVDNKIINVKFRDTAGQEIYRSNTKNYFIKSNGILLFFDITNKQSYEEIDGWLKDINDNNENVIIYLIGNKVDKLDKREVSKQDAKDFAIKNNMVYRECSCLNGIGVYEVVNEIIYQVVSNGNIDDELNNNISLNSIKLIDKQKLENASDGSDNNCCNCCK